MSRSGSSGGTEREQNAGQGGGGGGGRSVEEEQTYVRDAVELGRRRAITGEERGAPPSRPSDVVATVSR